MQSWRVQPVTTIVLTAALAGLQQWAALALVGAVMFVGAVWPSVNVIDYWISFVSRAKHRTTLLPRRFATGMGGVMLFAAGWFGLYGSVAAAWTFAAMTIAAASLLALFKYCVGCWIYTAMVAPLIGRRADSHP